MQEEIEKPLWEARRRIDENNIEVIDLYVDGKFYKMEDGFNALIELGKRLSNNNIEEFKKKLIGTIEDVSMFRLGDGFACRALTTNELTDLINNFK